MANLSGGWLILGWCCGFEIWDGADGFEICGCADLSGCFVLFCFVLFYLFIFFLGGIGGCGFVPVATSRCWWPLLLLMVMIERR